MRCWVVTLVVGITICASTSASAATKENAVKAGFIYNFTKFVTWPANAPASKNFHLCIIEHDRLDGSLEALYGKLVGSKPLILRRDMDTEEVTSCHMVFITEDNKHSVEDILKKFEGLPVVTVSDSQNFTRRGGMIGLIRDGNRVGFVVNMEPVNAVGLHISVQLLKLAKDVKGLK